MTHLRRENLPVVTRKLAEDVWVQTLDGNKTRAVSWCKCCKTNKPLNAFYLKSHRDRKHNSDVRDYCCVCFEAQSEAARHKRERRKVDKALIALFNLLD